MHFLGVIEYIKKVGFLEKIFGVIDKITGLNTENFTFLDIFDLINLIVLAILGVMSIYITFFDLLSLVATRKFPKAKKNHKYAFVIPARNESKVIGNLIESIKNQRYPAELVTIFVVADNCTDDTAQIARNAGAICYERFDNEHKTKGYALQFLFEQIERDYGRQSFEGYFVFDADNILAPNYIEKMNESFDSGEKIITSYRNSKNIDENLVASMTSMHFLITSRFTHRSRSFLGVSTRVQGTGFLFASEIVKDGWNFVRLTEDRAFSSDCITKGYKISYNFDAIFYDEQPTDLKIFFRQKLRWEKGFLQVIGEWGWRLLKGIFKQRSPNAPSKCFSNYDMFYLTIPKGVITFALRLLLYICGIISFFIYGGSTSVFWMFFWTLLIGKATAWGYNCLRALVVFVLDGKRVKKMPFFKKIAIILVFPFFYAVSTLLQIIAIFTKVEWKPIPHKNDTKMQDIAYLEKKKNN